MGMTARYDDTALEELLGAYALDACEPDESAAIEEMLARRPDLVIEANHLSNAAAWIGATGALAPPTDMRGNLLRIARDRRPAADGPARAYAAAASRTEQVIAGFDEDDADEPTPNGLRARDLLAHLASQESLLAQSLGEPVEPEITELRIEERTAQFVDRYRTRSIDDLRAVFRRSSDVVRRWAEDPSSIGTTVGWLGLEWPRDNLLAASAFEKWIHRDDLRRVRGLPLDPPPADEMHEMSDLSLRTLPMALLVSGRSHADRVARVVLTGPGGGDWLIAMGGGRVPVGATADVTLTADVVEWCLVAGERMDPSALPRTVIGDESLADDLVTAAPAFAML
jgi:uncharacterized protein (TIGR03083 family)